MASPGTGGFDGFISYSHAADDLLAPRLQAGLQRFAKPWWRRRALRVFRDESSLSANPHLWASIAGALDGSDWFILLLSEDAGRSEWVNREVEYWLENKDPSHIIPVVTDGEFGWEGAAIDPSSTVVPPALSTAFSEEPRWVDLRWARTEEQLDLNNARFRDAVADIASAVRAIPKDELESEEVRQHRRTIRTAWAAAFAVFALAVAATVGAVVAVGQSNEAESQRDEALRQTGIAETERDRANQLADDEAAARAAAVEARSQAEANAAEAEAQRAEAEAQREDADRQRVLAEQQARLARSRELAASAIGVLDNDPELSLLLALSAVEEAPEASDFPEGRIALRRALSEQLLGLRLQVAESGWTGVAVSGDATRLAVSSVSGRSVTMFDVATGDELWTYRDTATVDWFGAVAMSPDGSLVAVVVDDVRIEGEFPELGLAPDQQDRFPRRVVILDAHDGSVITTVVPGECETFPQQDPAFSPDGSLLAVWAGASECESVGGIEDWVALYDTGTWEETHRFDLGPHDSVSFSADMSLVVVRGDGVPTELRTWPAMELIAEFPPSHVVALSPDGSRVVLGNSSGRSGGDVDFRLRVFDSATGELSDVLDGPESFHEAGPYFSPDGSRLYLGTRTGALVWDVETGAVLHNLGLGAVPDMSVDGTGTLVATATSSGEAMVWDLSEPDAGVVLQSDETVPVWFNPNAIETGARTAIQFFGSPIETGTFPYFVAVVEPATGELGGEARVFMAAGLPDGRFVALLESTRDGTDWRGPLVVWDPESGGMTELDGCIVAAGALNRVDEVLCDDGEPFFGASVAVSRDGSEFAVESYVPEGEHAEIRFWDAQTLEPGRTVRSAEPASANDFLPTYLTSEWTLYWGSSVAIIDPRDGSLITHLVEGPPWRGSAELSPDGSHLYLGTHGGEIYRFDTTTWEAEAWRANEGENRGSAVSPDGSKIVAAGADDFVRIWSTSDFRLLDLVSLPMASDAMWIDDQTIAVALAGGARWAVVSLDEADLLAEAAQALTRAFTGEECALYGIDPCPTLEDIRGA